MLDLHEGFHDPQRARARDLARFLEDADRLPGTRAIQREMRRALDLGPGVRLLDAGCGAGLEAVRLARENPEMAVTALDRNAEVLAIGRRRADPPPPNLDWVHADLTALALPEASFDAIRTERVLMYLPGAELDRALANLARLLRPGGRMALFELDYGATFLAPGGADAAVAEHAQDLLRRSLPQPLCGRRIPGLLTELGLRDVGAIPHSFTVSPPVWRRIVRDTLLATPELDPAVADWLAEQDERAGAGEFVAAFTGVLTTARSAAAPAER